MKHYLIKIFLSVYCISGCLSVNGQEVVTNPQCNTNLIYRKASLPNAAKRMNDTLQLPFFDDFSNKDVYPKADLWLDSFVYVNDHFQRNAVSYGVATFDGLNQYGRPYFNSPANVYGTADTLTSKMIDLSAYTQTDTTIYFSFMYQPRGLGDWPNEEDSLILEFKKLTSWETVWATGGFTSPPDSPVFKIVMLPVNDAFYFVPDFQFRFRNLATSGNNDHWHLDYVYMNINRLVSDTVMNDLSVIGLPTRFLKNYTSMPWNQFADSQHVEVNPEINISYRNNAAVDRNMEFQYDVYQTFNGNTLLFDTIQSLSPFNPNNYFSKNYATSDWMQYTTTADSVVIQVRQYLTDVPSDIWKQNDTSYAETFFYNYLAYDDGSAEKAYGLEGPGLKKFAYEFNLNKPDTLRAIMAHFTYLNRDVSNLLLTLFIWDDINFNTGAEDTLFKKDFLKPLYIDSLNGFVTYVLDTPVYLEAGKFYIGWQQFDNYNMQLGLDVNNSAQSRIRIFANGNWITSVVDAAPMIRPVIGKRVNFVNTSIAEKHAELQHLLIYPNPSSAILQIDNLKSNSNNLLVEIYDLNGKLTIATVITNGKSTVDVHQLPQGTYVVVVKDANGTLYRPQRLVKM
jgi:DNA-binding protein